MAWARQASGLTVAALFAAAVRRGPGRIALEAGGRSASYAQLDTRSNRLANHLHAIGLARGDRVAILSENRGEYIELLIAAAKLGVTVACQNWRLAQRELRHCIELVAPRLLLTSDRYAEEAHALAAGRATLAFGADYESALRRASPAPPPASPEPEDGLAILYTSGTTGLPKGALVSQRAEVARSSVLRFDLPNGPDDRYVAWSPLFHMAAADTALAALLQGRKVIVTDGFDAERLAAIVARERLGWLLLLPGTVAAFLDAMRRQRHGAAGVRWVGAMADLVPRDQIAEVTELLRAPFLNTFGSTETGMPPGSGAGIGVGIVPRDLPKTQSSLCDVRLVDDADCAVPEGEPGELVMRGPTLFSGYWNDRAASAAAFRNGWFHMGDVFRRNPDGTLAFIDRRKYLIKSGGENIYPAEIERVLLSDPRVAEAVVVRRADARWGEVPVAFVVRRDAAVDAATLLAMCRGRIADYKVPREVRFVDAAALPRSATGKVQRGELEDRLAAGVR